MGAVLATRLATALEAAGMDPASVSINSLIDPLEGSSAAIDGVLQVALGSAIQGVFVIAFGAAVLALVASFFAPGGRIGAPDQNQAASEAQQPTAAVSH